MTAKFSDESGIVALCMPDRVTEAFSEHIDMSEGHVLHMTLATLGDLKEESISKCVSLLHEKAKQLRPIYLDFRGEGALRLNDGLFCKVALANGPGVDIWRYEISSALMGENLLNGETEGFLPHITLEFAQNNDRILPPGFGIKPVMMDRFYLLRGQDLKIPIFVGRQEDSQGG